ncbi:MAG TPA: NAD-dependent malic enzyme [Vicinamibacteria bacterium]|nr:NAD-dependent malic enzyme [Vicinamibacteria bacterium]
MEAFRRKRGADGRERIEVRLRGAALLNHPMYNRSTAFTREERRALALEGLLPPVVSTMEQQARRAYGNIVRKGEALERYIGLAALQDRNEHLFYRVLTDHLEEFLPIVYTPTVGLACQQYSKIFRRARGLWINPGHKGRMTEVLANAPYEDVRLIVVTDNERILGLGDQGAGGMGIPVGKLALYCAGAGIPPSQTLPISLDVGTDNEKLLADDLYIGWREPRLRGEAYDAIVDEFVRAVKQRFPRALLQWEDFKQWNAFRLLERYRKELPSFNDDIQGTAAVAVAGIVAASRSADRRLAEERVVIAGAGAAGVGIARLLRRALEREGLSGEALLPQVAMLDSKGLVVDATDPYRKELAWTSALASAHGLQTGSSLLEVVKATRPTVLVGVSGVPGLFGEEVVRAMAAQVQRPVIFPLSNPTSSSEACPADVMAWTGGRALMATGSPFDPVEVDGRPLRIGQGNNAFVFPGVGLGVLVCEAREVTDAMFAAAADALAGQLSEDDRAAGCLFPRIASLRRVTAAVACAVIRQAVTDGVAGNPPADPATVVAAAMWEPAYPVIEVV